jgi:3'-phosphoadenosine 5'-phosphosulfate sulfotransferase (PAPS reductase)/FAD synthetase
MAKQERHILALSGGKDSAALAVYMREKRPDLPMEYVFTDSGCELQETHSYINRVRAVLNISITTIGGANPEDRKDFLWWLKAKGDYLPSPQNRWCTEVLKIIPYNNWIMDKCHGQIVHSYVGLRADEKRERKGNFRRSDDFYQHHPFMEDGLVYDDIKELLESSGIGFPAYYKWRSRSGCYFCFYQTKREWLGLHDHHEKLFWQAAEMEKVDPSTGKQYTWCEGITLRELVNIRDSILANAKEITHSQEKCPKLAHALSKCCQSISFNLGNIIRKGGENGT